MTLAGCPSDAPVEDDGAGATESSTGSVVTTADGTGPTPTTVGSSSSAASESTSSASADSGSSESTAGTSSTGLDSTDSSSTGSGSTGTGSGSTDSGSTGSGSTDSGSTDSGSTDSGSTDSSSSSEGSTTGEDDIGFQQCDSPEDCLPGEGCLNDTIENPTVAVCFFEGCVTDDDCPAIPAGGDSDAFCVDVTGDGVDDCVIVCSSTVCPTGMECFSNSICVWPLE